MVEQEQHFDVREIRQPLQRFLTKRVGELNPCSAPAPEIVSHTDRFQLNIHTVWFPGLRRFGQVRSNVELTA